MSLLAAIAGVAIVTQSPNISHYTQTNLRDLRLTAHVVKKSTRELVKINKDYGRSYEFEETTIQAKDPFMVRVDTRVEDTDIVYILNGVKQVWRVKGGKIPTDLSHDPGRRQTWLDFGLITDSLFKNFFVAKFVRMDRATGDAVFDVSYSDPVDTSRHRIWVSPEKKYVTKREWYSQGGRLKATFYYESPKNVSGVWLPTLLTVKNVEGAVAGVTRYDLIRVNTGLAEELFKTN